MQLYISMSVVVIGPWNSREENNGGTGTNQAKQRVKKKSGKKDSKKWQEWMGAVYHEIQQKYRDEREWEEEVGRLWCARHMEPCPSNNLLLGIGGQTPSKIWWQRYYQLHYTACKIYFQGATTVVQWKSCTLQWIILCSKN